jgi:hypothetical protein
MVRRNGRRALRSSDLRVTTTLREVQRCLQVLVQVLALADRVAKLIEWVFGPFGPWW